MHQTWSNWWGLIGLGALLMVGCGIGDDTQKTILAEVGDRRLYLEDLDGLVPTSASFEDSTRTLNLYVERWVREAVVLNEAETSVSQSLDIEQLVEDYRSSLIKHNYEKVLVETKLDSTISQQAIDEYYQTHREQYTLTNAIVKGQIVVVNKDENNALIRSVLLEKAPVDEEQLRSWRENPSINGLLDTIWYDASKFISVLPKGTLTEKNLKTERREVSDANYRYFYRIDELLNAGEPAPVDYVASTIRRVLLHQRKSALLKQKREELYERELRNKNIKIYN